MPPVVVQQALKRLGIEPDEAIDAWFDDEVLASYRRTRERMNHLDRTNEVRR